MDQIKIIWVYFNNLNEICANLTTSCKFGWS